MSSAVRRWAGGRVVALRDGTLRWHLEKMIRGRRVSVALRVTSEAEALAELALFRRDPTAWLAGREADDAAGVAVRVDAATVEAFAAHLLAQGRSARYVGNVIHYLAEWDSALAGRDLRTVGYPELRRLLDGWTTGEKHRIIAIKSLCGWLREKRAVLPRASDPTLDLRVPPARPERALRDKGYALDHVAAVYACVEPQDVRDVLCLRALTGMHETEAGRVARGDCAVREVNDPSGIAAVLRFAHKSGRIHLQSVTAQPLAAARRLMARGADIDNKRQHRELDKAARRAGVEPIEPGELRHSFVTWARQGGVLVQPQSAGLPLATVAEAVGHTSPRTTALYYDGTAVPPLVVVPLWLCHVSDPPWP